MRSGAYGAVGADADPADAPENNGHARILVGCEMTNELPQPTPPLATLNVHRSRFSDLERPTDLLTTPLCLSTATAIASGTGAAVWFPRPAASP